MSYRMSSCVETEIGLFHVKQCIGRCQKEREEEREEVALAPHTAALLGVLNYNVAQFMPHWQRRQQQWQQGMSTQTPGFTDNQVVSPRLCP